MTAVICGDEREREGTSDVDREHGSESGKGGEGGYVSENEEDPADVAADVKAQQTQETTKYEAIPTKINKAEGGRPVAVDGGHTYWLVSNDNDMTSAVPPKGLVELGLLVHKFR